MKAVITGGTRGIGLSAAMALGKAGYDIILTGINQEDGEKAIQELEASGVNAELYMVNGNTARWTCLSTMLAVWVDGSALRAWKLLSCGVSWP